MKKQFLTILCTIGLWAGAVHPGAALAQAVSSTASATFTVSELAGTWVEPVTNSNADGLIVAGSENIVTIEADGRFADGLDLSFEFADSPEFNGTYRITSQGRISVTADSITWATESAQAVPVFPANADSARRDAMQELADRLAEGMVGSETYPVIAYDGREMVMNAGSDSVFEEYVMTRR